MGYQTLRTLSQGGTHPEMTWEIQFASLLWHGCLKNGSLHRGSHLQLKEQLWLAERVPSKWHPPLGGSHLQLKEQIWLVQTDGHFRGAFCLLFQLHNAMEAPPNQSLNTNWQKKHLRDIAESTLRCTLNACGPGWGSTIKSPQGCTITTLGVAKTKNPNKLKKYTMPFFVSLWRVNTSWGTLLMFTDAAQSHEHTLWSCGCLCRQTGAHNGIKTSIHLSGRPTNLYSLCLVCLSPLL